MSGMSIEYRVLKTDKRYRETALVGKSSDSGIYDVSTFDVTIDPGDFHTFNVTHKAYVNVDGDGLTMTLTYGATTISDVPVNGFISLPGEHTLRFDNPAGVNARPVRVKAVIT